MFSSSPLIIGLSFDSVCFHNKIFYLIVARHTSMAVV